MQGRTPVESHAVASAHASIIILSRQSTSPLAKEHVLPASFAGFFPLLLIQELSYSALNTGLQSLRKSEERKLYIAYERTNAEKRILRLSALWI